MTVSLSVLLERGDRVKDIKSYSLKELEEEFVTELNLPRFRAKQVYKWLTLGVESFEEMTDISKELRNNLSNTYYISVATIEKKLVSVYDKTVKYLFKLYDGEFIESVGRSNGNGKGRYPCPVHKLNRLLRGGEAAALLLAQFCHIAKFGLHVGAVRLCHLNGFGRCLHILLEGLFRCIYHNGVKALVKAPLDKFQAGAVVQVDVALEAVIGQNLTAHLVSGMKAHIVNGGAGELEHHGSVHCLCGLCHAEKGLVIIEICCQDGRFIGLALIEDFFNGFHRTE